MVLYKIIENFVKLLVCFKFVVCNIVIGCGGINYLNIGGF